LEDNQSGECRLDPKKIEARTFPAGILPGIFGAGAGGAAMPPLH